MALVVFTNQRFSEQDLQGGGARNEAGRHLELGEIGTRNAERRAATGSDIVKEASGMKQAGTWN